MLCEHCHGRRIVVGDLGAYPCPECWGRGEVHCCDGLQEQAPAANPQASVRIAPSFPGTGAARATTKEKNLDRRGRPAA